MAKVVVKSKVKKVKKKFPVELKAPEYLNSVSLGHSNVTDLGDLVGKTAKLNMMYVSGNVKNQNIRLKLKVTEVNSGLAKTQVSVYEQIPYYLGRFLKAGADLVEDSYVATTKDGVKVRVKPFVVTKMNTGTNVASALREETRKLIDKEAKEHTYEEFIANVISAKMQNSLRTDLKKVFPLKTFEFRKVELV